MLNCKYMINRKQKDAIISYFSADQRVIAVYLYGSLARGSANQLSDIDIAIMLERTDGHTLKLQLDAIGALMQIFHTNDVDVQILTPQTPPALAFRMIKGVSLYCSSLIKKVAIEAQILSRNQDFEPFMRLQIQEMEKRLEGGTYADRYSGT